MLAVIVSITKQQSKQVTFTLSSYQESLQSRGIVLVKQSHKNREICYQGKCFERMWVELT